MKEVLRWFPGILSGLVWVTLPDLVQPWLSQFGLFLYVDPILLLVPVLLFPLRPAVITILLCSLWADAGRAVPFGLSASLLLPALIIAHLFQDKILRWKKHYWFVLALGLNTALTFCFVGICAALATPKAAFNLHLENILLSLLISFGWCAVLSPWFFSFQLSFFNLARKNLLAEKLLLA